MAACALVCAAILLLPAPAENGAELRRLPRQNKMPPARDIIPSGPGATPPPVIQRIFGIGIRFEKTGTLQGVPVDFVLPGSPAARAGLVPGCVIAEINGTSTVGRAGDDCRRLISEIPGAITLRYYDPALKLRTLTLEKEWLIVPLE
jgi:membrane-associated protease RseP (regulator of RpoE activity)